MTNYLSCSQEEELFRAALIEGDFVLASGEHAHQKFEFDAVAVDPRLLKLTSLALAQCINDTYDGYDSIVSVANGATVMGGIVAAELGVQHIQTAYRNRNGEKKFRISREINDVTSSVIVDDVFTRGTNSKKVITILSGMGIETRGIAVVLDRSGNDQSDVYGVPVVSLINKRFS